MNLDYMIIQSRARRLARLILYTRSLAGDERAAPRQSLPTFARNSAEIGRQRPFKVCHRPSLVRKNWVRLPTVGLGLR